MLVLVVNCGSSTLKLRAVDNDEIVFRSDILLTEGAVNEAELSDVLAGVGPVDSVGHRIVHGGNLFERSMIFDKKVRAQLESLRSLAPLHQAQSLVALDVVGKALPQTPTVVCFDTSFHAALPLAAATYAVPVEWRERYEVRRYGFHGLSHSYAVRRASDLLTRPAGEIRIVSCHLGSGASLAAAKGGVSVDTTMGFTPLEGLVMATRSGTVDPGLLIWLQKNAGLPLEEVSDALEHRSGLKALAGTGDMRIILAGAQAGDARAQLALEVYIHRLCAGVASMVPSLGGLDALVFTAGVGENEWQVRARVAERLAFLGVHLDESKNRTAAGDADISAEGAPIRSLVVASREDLEIARETRRVLRG